MIAMSTMQVRTALSAHHQMMLDIRSVLKSLAHVSNDCLKIILSDVVMRE
jgi:hypothetical protein